MIYSRTHKKDRTIKRTLSLLLAGLMMLGLYNRRADADSGNAHPGMHGRAIANTVASGIDSETDTGIFIL